LAARWGGGRSVRDALLGLAELSLQARGPAAKRPHPCNQILGGLRYVTDHVEATIMQIPICVMD
jgi:hypothetical protein